MTSKTEAEGFMEMAGAYNGTNFDWQSSDDPAVVAKLDRARRSYEPEYGTRYEWPDGSALVEHGDGWDRGIHRDRLDEVQAILDAAQDPDGNAIYEPAGCRTPAEYQWANDNGALMPGEQFHRPAADWLRQRGEMTIDFLKDGDGYTPEQAYAHAQAVHDAELVALTSSEALDVLAGWQEYARR